MRTTSMPSCTPQAGGSALGRAMASSKESSPAAKQNCRGVGGTATRRVRPSSENSEALAAIGASGMNRQACSRAGTGRVTQVESGHARFRRYRTHLGHGAEHWHGCARVLLSLGGWQAAIRTTTCQSVKAAATAEQPMRMIGRAQCRVLALRGGSPCADVPERCGPCTTCYNSSGRYRAIRATQPNCHCP